ncbi:hypothetical protein T02_13202 [Trichinella nativa]|uniref:Uncharacterized protein n=1 Tax=Trichinella nativa TaxID=6335 RepID=A0A0V1KWJ8_9BILA|nr:hypothetical protein T02_13202 [Trichinella nativa]
MVRWGSGSKPPRSKPLIYRRAASRVLSARQWRDQISVDPPRCPPAAKYFYILERRRPSGQLVSWRAWSASAVTIRTGKNREHEDETARAKTSRRRVITGELERTRRKRTRRPRPAGRYKRYSLQNF